MSNRFDRSRRRLAGVALTVALVFATVPVAAQAAAVDLGTAKPFVVLGGSEVTNTGPSVLNGDLGLAPGTAINGFGPGIVNGTTHANDAVASQGQSDLTTAFGVAAGQPVPPGNELTGIDLGGLTLTPGAYGYSTSAQLTGQLTLNAQGNPNAQFVFVIGSTLTTASASSVLLTNGASPCNVYWKVGSSATLGTGTKFQGNLMALTDVTLNTGTSVVGRVLARNGIVSLDTNTVSNAQCRTGPTPTPAETAPGGGGTTSTGPTAVGPNRKKAAAKAEAKGTATLTRGKRSASGVRATVHGRRIEKVTFTDGGVPIGGPGSPRQVLVPATPGVHVVVAHVTFTDGTHSKTMRFRFRVPTPVLHPRQGSSQFTG